jgi:hypothetical protein
MTMRQEVADSVTSYGLSGMAFAVTVLADVAKVAEAMTIILACVVVILRVAYDAVRLWRYLKGKE